MRRRPSLDRRLFLKGLAGTAIALPLLEFTHATAWAQSVTGVPKRFIVFFEHGGSLTNSNKNGGKFDGKGAQNGVDAWKPVSLPGQPLQLGAIHQPLVGMEDQLLVLRGIDNLHCKHDSPYNGDHGWANASALTATKCVKPDADSKPRAEGPSIDAVLASRLASRNPVAFPSIQLRASAHNYGTPFYRAARQPSSSESNPNLAFDRIFANVTASEGGAPDQAALKRRFLSRSILDGTGESLNRLKGKVSATDLKTIDAHLEHIRGLEERLAQLELPSAPGCTPPTLASSYSGVDKIGPAQIDNLIAAMRCGLTNVATFELGDFHATWLNPSFDAAYNIGHSLHHASRDVGETGEKAAQFQSWYETMLQNRQFRAQLFRRLMDGLAATPEGDGTMLDNTVILWTSEFSTGAEHSVADLPILLAGKGAGRIRTGRHVNYNELAVSDPNTRSYRTSASLHNLFTSILNAFDFPDANWGSPESDFVKSSGTLITRYVPGPLPDVAS